MAWGTRYYIELTMVKHHTPYLEVIRRGDIERWYRAHAYLLCATDTSSIPRRTSVNHVRSYALLQNFHFSLLVMGDVFRYHVAQMIAPGTQCIA